MSKQTRFQDLCLDKLSLLSTTALIGVLTFGGAALAQDAPAADEPVETTTSDEDAPDDTVVVRGIRGSLANAAEIKREADTVVDSITASDVATLPDLSVAEALSRIPGVTVTRFEQGGDSGDFPSPEGTGNLIRGLGFVRSEFNGRDAFTANGGRALDWASIPPELIGGVDVYKNQSADLIEGGIGGTINLRTLEPFDREGLIAVLIADSTYTDIREKWSPSYSAVLGDRWDTGLGEFGLLGSISTSELKSRVEGYQASPIVPRDDLSSLGNGVDALGATPGFQLRTNEVDRDRDSYYIAGQWRNPAETIEATAKYIRVENDIRGIERTTEWFPDANTANSGRIELSDLTIDQNFSADGVALCNGNNEPSIGFCDGTVPVSGLMESGLVSDNGNSWFGAYGLEVSNLGIGRREESHTQDVSLNVKWNATDRLFLEFDGHVVEAESSFEQLWIGTNTFANVFTVSGIDNPNLQFFIDPRTALNPAQIADPRTDVPVRPTSTADPFASWINHTADQFRDGTGDLYALRADGEYDFANDGWFDSVKFGVRYSEREQLNQETALNWAGVSPPWAGSGMGMWGNLDNPQFEVVDFADFQRGGLVTGDNTQFIYAAPSLLTDYNLWLEMTSTDPDLANGLWNPLRTADGVVDYANRGTVSDIVEETMSFYGRLDFFQEFSNGMSIDGNVGLRYVSTDVESNGELSYNEFGEDLIEPSGAGTLRTDEAESRDNARDFLPDLAAFLDQANIGQTVSSSDEFWLPSLNVKWNLNEEMLIRFGVSQSITRPNIAEIRAGQQVGAGLSIISFDQGPGDPFDGFEDIIFNSLVFTGGNPNLEPTEAVNWDVTYEWYYGNDNSFTFGVFYKELENVISYGAEVRDTVTFDGQTGNVIFVGSINQDEVEISGFEVATLHFFDNWPGLFGNLGVQANYSYIDASATPPASFVDNDLDGQPDPGTFGSIFRYNVGDLLGQSEHTANLIGIYQDERIEARLAYNYRSEYLNSYRDFVTGNPVYQSATGFLDASFRYELSDNLQFRVLAANLLDTEIEAESQIDAEGQRFGRSSFISDRRYEIGLKWEF